MIPSAGVISSQLDYDALSFINTAGITNSTHILALNYLAFQLKTNSLWSKMYAVYPVVGGTATTHSYNLINTANYRITFSGTVTHSSNGMISNGTTGYGLTGLIPSTVLDNSNLASLGFYSRTNTPFVSGTAPYAMGSVGSNASPGTFSINIRANQLNIFAMDRAGVTNRSANNNTLTNSSGFFAGSQNGTTAAFYRNGSNITLTQTAYGGLNISNTQVAILTLNYNTGGNNITDWITPHQCAFAHIGQKLTDAEMSTLYTIVQQYQTILGRQV